jgi:hypothetical protein
VVKSLNGLTDSVILSAGTNITLNPSGNTIQISASGGGAGASSWVLGGNAGTTTNNFLGTTDNSTLELRANNARALRIEPHAASPNLIGGSASNKVSAGVVGGFIGGGGDINNPNQLLSSYGTVGGGGANSSGFFSTVGGGTGNIASGDYSIIPGGNGNTAIGAGSFAAGRNAHAYHNGSFIWGDGVQAANTTGDNRFEVNAFGGINFYPGGNNVYIASPAALAFGGSVRQMLSLYDDGTYKYGIGVQYSTLYQRAGAGGGFAWYSGGVHSNTQNDPGAGGTTLMTLDSSGSLTTTGDANIGNTVSLGNSFYMGNVVVGSSGEFVVYGQRVYPQLAPVRFSIDPAGNANLQGNLLFGKQTRQMLDLWDDGAHAYGIGVQGFTLYQRAAAGGGFAWYSGGVHNDAQDNSGGGTTLMTLDSAGVLSVPVLQITGGADVAEPFKMATESLPKGSVVVIDDEAAGQLKLSDHAYDTRVAGIVSGANGINPGLSLRQAGLTDGSQNVALSGRVYVLADASTGAIKPGDLLTTSATPGHAMKVTNHAQAQGAILGKAMSSLPTGRGMVLVLVTLQ